jgi:hypothetical protein
MADMEHILVAKVQRDVTSKDKEGRGLFENSVLRRMFGSKGVEISGMGKISELEFCNFEILNTLHVTILYLQYPTKCIPI